MASSKRSRYQRFLEHEKRRRCYIITLVLALFIIITIGVVFIAHYFYQLGGGKGFLKTRNLSTSPQNVEGTQLYLPMKKLAMQQKICDVGDGGEEVAVAASDEHWLRAETSVPFYACGDQQNSCEKFEQLDVCCPVTMTCHATTYTPSGIYCCNTTGASQDCESSSSDRPQCLPGTSECSADLGGGCCIDGTECSLNGCIQFSKAKRAVTTKMYLAIADDWAQSTTRMSSAMRRDATPSSESMSPVVRIGDAPPATLLTSAMVADHAPSTTSITSVVGDAGLVTSTEVDVQMPLYPQDDTTAEYEYTITSTVTITSTTMITNPSILGRNRVATATIEKLGEVAQKAHAVRKEQFPMNGLGFYLLSCVLLVGITFGMALL